MEKNKAVQLEWREQRQLRLQKQLGLSHEGLKMRLRLPYPTSYRGP